MSQEKDNGKWAFSKPLILSDFANQVGVDIGAVIKYFFIKGRVTNVNVVLTLEDCKELCEHFGIEFEESKEDTYAKDLFSEYLNVSNFMNPINKDPVVTVMGHVDHGKTTLLDRIRGTDVTKREFGGITQHLGAYSVERNGRKIVFLDTPGHQAFTKMRARGANVTDIVVLVVAADDGVMPQTKEAIQHALAANAKIVVFINKIDKGIKKIPDLKKALLENDLVLEEFGGDVMCVEGSALQGVGIDALLDSLILLSDISEFKTTLETPAVGAIVESRVETGLGKIAISLLFRGIVEPGDFLVTKSTISKIRSLFSTDGRQLLRMDPSTPAQISGFKELPEVGDRFVVFKKESDSKEFSRKLGKYEAIKEVGFVGSDEDILNLSVIVKSDVSGSLEAIKEIVYANNIPIVSSGIGSVSDSDLQLAVVSKSMIINFNQSLTSSIKNRAKDMKLTLKSYRSIYEIEEDLEKIIESKRIIDLVEEKLGEAHVLKLWYHSKVGTIAGCKVVFGVISKTDKIKILRNGEELVSSTIKSFKTESYEIKECVESQECGIVVNNWNDIKVGDVIEAFRMVEKV